jgi:hypothetical protein
VQRVGEALESAPSPPQGSGAHTSVHRDRERLQDLVQRVRAGVGRYVSWSVGKMDSEYAGV